jgi:hypothetical protein
MVGILNNNNFRKIYNNKITLLDCFKKFKVTGDSFASPSYQKQGLNHRRWHLELVQRRRSVAIQPSRFFFVVVSDELGLELRRWRSGGAVR